MWEYMGWDLANFMYLTNNHMYPPSGRRLMTRDPQQNSIYEG